MTRAPQVGPCQALYMQPFGEVAGVASAMQILARTLLSAAASVAATALVARFGVRGLCFLVAATALAVQPTRLLLAAEEKASSPRAAGYVSLAGGGTPN